MTSIYDFTAKTIEGEEQPLSDYKGKVLLIVNTASKCGFTPQFDGLQKLYDQYKDQGFEVLGFPCNQFGHQDPGADEEINQFCKQNYGVSFQMFSKVNVKGKNVHPLFAFLTSEQKGILGEQIKWNFTKFLINQDGEVLKRFGPQKNPDIIEKDIEALLNE
ncbi:glutathione peroxidase [Oceanobacillus neutriphilus]|uniref:Glutathione peroxidase n=1 Tax=Oceanobacillus neutriphilus TaxID=531815 RepID=A0ABQ2P079_9BACI|nr:glutathione peroxidase [Oceanobacillus neutriphilus]GGP14871.1 glutathione peroxidase [Oceanobacillus neutriphilus]